MFEPPIHWTDYEDIALEELEHDATYKAVLIAPATETTTAIDTFFRYLKLDVALRPLFDEVILEHGGHPTAWFSVARAAAHIKAQVLWVHDTEDMMTPFADIENVQNAGFPNFQFLITTGLGHRRIYRDNNVLKAIVAFL